MTVSRSALAVFGLCTLMAAAFVVTQPDLRLASEQRLLGWLQSRHMPEMATLPGAALVQRAAALVSPQPAQASGEPAVALDYSLAADPKILSRQQLAVATWLSRRYQVAPEPLTRLVQAAWQVGPRAGIDPTLILAVMAIESRFNPFAQSSVGAQGLMQVMTKVHNEKYEIFGGKLSAFDPVTNLRVGVQVLKECIARGGGLEAGLRFYVGAANLPTDGGYAAKVLAEQQHLRRVAAGQSVPANISGGSVPVRVAAASSAKAAEPSAPRELPGDGPSPSAADVSEPAPVSGVQAPSEASPLPATAS